MSDPGFTVPSAADEAKRLSEALINGKVHTNAALREEIGDDVVSEAEAKALLLAEAASTVAQNPELQRPAFGFGGFGDLDLPDDDGDQPPAVTFTGVLDDVALFGDPEPEVSADTLDRPTFSGTVASDDYPDIDYQTLATLPPPPTDTAPDPGTVEPGDDAPPWTTTAEDVPEPAGDPDDDYADMDQDAFDALGADDPLQGSGLLDSETTDYLGGDDDYSDPWAEDPAPAVPPPPSEPVKFTPPVPVLPSGADGTPTITDTTAELNPPLPPDFFDDADDFPATKEPGGPSVFGKVFGGIGGALTGLRRRITRLPRRVQIVIAAVAVTLVVVLVLSMTGTGERQDTTPVPAVPTVQPPTTGDEEQDGALIPSKVSAKCAERSTSPKEAFSAQEGAAWVCLRSHGIDGGVMNIVFPKPVILSEIQLIPGFNRVQSNGKDEWNLHRVITRIKWRAGGKTFIQEIVPARTVAVFTFPEPVTTTSMALIIQQSVDPDQTVGDTGGGASSPLGGGSPVDATAVMGLKLIGREA